jgi:hypothetical protein
MVFASLACAYQHDTLLETCEPALDALIRAADAADAEGAAEGGVTAELDEAEAAMGLALLEAQVWIELDDLLRARTALRSARRLLASWRLWPTTPGQLVCTLCPSCCCAGPRP